MSELWLLNGQPIEYDAQDVKVGDQLAFPVEIRH